MNKKSTTEIVFEAVEDLHAQEQIVTREVLAEVTGLKLVTIDDRLGHLVDCERIRRVQRGVYVPQEQHPPARAVTRTVLPDGSTVLEVGDTVLQLTPREARMVGELMAGAGQQFAAIGLGHRASLQTSDLRQRLNALERELHQVQQSAGCEAA